MVNKLIKKTAKDLAGAFFDNMDVFHDGRVERTTTFREQCKDQRAFINQYWTDFVPVARKTLIAVLEQPGTTQIQKDAIYDAFLEDRGFMGDEMRAAPSVMRLN